MWSPNNAEWVYIQFAAAKARSDPGQHQPGVSNRGTALRAGPVRVPRAGRRAKAFKSSDYAAMIAEVRPTCPTSSTSSCWTARMGGAAGGRRRASLRTTSRTRSIADQRRSHQHPVHEWHHRLSQGSNAQPSQPVEQRLLPRRGVPVHRGRPGVHPGALLPLLRHGHRQPRQPHPRRRPRCCRRRRSSRSRRCGQWKPSGARACSVCRRCSSPCSPIPSSTSVDLSSLRTGMMAGSPCPVEVMRQCVDEMHMSEVTIGYGMTETSPVSRQTSPRRSARQARRHRRPSAPTCAGQDRRSEHR